MGLFLPKSKKPSNLHLSKYRLIQACVYRHRNISSKFGSYEINERYISDPNDKKYDFRSHRFDIWQQVSQDSKKKVFSFIVSYDKFDVTESIEIDRYVAGAWTDLILEDIKEEVFL